MIEITIPGNPTTRPVHPTKEEIEAKARELFPVSMKSEKPGYEYPEQKTKEAEKA